MDSGSDVSTAGTAAAVPGSAWRLQGIFFEPKRTFEAIAQRPNWLLPLLLAAAISFSAALFVYSRIDIREVVIQQLNSSPQGRNMSEEDRERAVEMFTNSSLARAARYAGPLLMPLISSLLLAGLLVLAMMLLGGETTFAKLFSVTCHTSFFYTAVVSMLTVVIFGISDDPNSIDVSNVVKSNLGPLVSTRESPALYRLLAGIDLIVFYHIYLLGLGVSTVTPKTSLARGITAVGALYVIWLAINVGFATLGS